MTDADEIPRWALSQFDLAYLCAFVEGAKWWQFNANGATAFPSEIDEMEAEAVRRLNRHAAESAREGR